MQVTGPKIKISVRDTMIAMDRMGKNKAAAADELLDTLFQVKEWKELERKLRRNKTLKTN